MHRTPQTQGQSVLDHGLSVNKYLHDLISQKHYFNWKLPDWYAEYSAKLISLTYDQAIIDQYTIYHDCGKPYCYQLDASGNHHFPEHALLPKIIYLSLLKDQVTANLIGWDMVLHTSNAKELQNYLLIWSKQDAATLLLVALAEIHSNAAMFGGIDSTSFKIKWKQIQKRGKQICRYLFKCEEKNEIK